MSEPFDQIVPRVQYDRNRLRAEGYFSQNGQDKFLAEGVFNNLSTGTFIDVGAWDGVDLSNTYYFEKVRGWNGLAIEPLPDQFKKLKRARRCTCIEGCVSDQNGSASLQVAGTLSGLADKCDPRHRVRIQKEYSDRTSIQTCPVTTYRLNTLASKFEIGLANYLSLDTEGGETEILQSVDFDCLKVSVISIEKNFPELDFSQCLPPDSYRHVATVGDDEIYFSNEFCHSLLSNSAVVNVATATGWYPKGQQRLCRTLLKRGIFDGDIYTYSDEKDVGSPVHDITPYAFKPFALDEIRRRGYQVGIWCDASAWPVRPLDDIIIHTRTFGLWAEYEGDIVANWCHDEALKILEISREEASEIRMIVSGVLAFDFRNPTTNKILDEWLALAKDGRSFRGSWTNHRHDQTVLSILLHKHSATVLTNTYQSVVRNNNQQPSVIFQLDGM